MDFMTYAEARASLKRAMDRVIHDRVEIAVTRKDGEAIVMISLDEYNAIQETLHLQKGPENVRRLRASIAQLNAGVGSERDLTSARPRRSETGSNRSPGS